jgi:splicing factor 3B subunit 2
MNRLTVAELKQLVDKPDVIEVHDVTANDPRLLVLLKAARNTVPVPKHWAQKRKYLQNKRGIEKPSFELPQYIIDTGITEMREALQEKEDRMGLRGKMRDKARPKMGKIDIDYQKLHDAFFRWQTKPKMTAHGDLYYEGKEYETKVTNKKPGELSDELRVALGMPVGEEAAAGPIPPPWLLHMQRYGPPPSYPNLKIAGLNAPLPEGAQFGYQAGDWGKVPVDELGKPVYGDVFGTGNKELEAREAEVQPSVELWGQLESESEEESESEDESDAERSDGEETGTATPSGYTSETPSGLTSVDTGIETPDAIELRKRRIEDAMDDNGEAQTLYKVISQKDAGTAASQGMMGSTHVYDVAGAMAGPAAGAAAAKGKGKKGITPGGMEMALDDPEQLANMDQEALKEKFDAAAAEKDKDKDDFSDLVADHRAKTAKKRKQDGKKTDDKGAKKFKF